MSREKNLAKNTFVYFVGTFGSKMLTFLLLPLYSNYLTQSAFGSYDLINTFVQLLYPFITLMLDNAMYVFILNPDGYKRDEVVSVALRVLCINSIITVVISFVINAIYPIQYLPWIIVWLIAVSAYNMFIQICRGYNKPALYSMTGVIITALTLVGNIVGILILKMDYKSLIIANMIANIGGCIFLEFKLHIVKLVKVKVTSVSLKKRLFAYSVPLIPNTLSWWVINLSDRFMISFFIGTAANGVYSMASKIPAILTIVHSIFSLAWADDVLKSADLKTTEIYANKIYNQYMTTMLGLTAILVCSNKSIFEYIIGGNFIESYHYTYFLYLGCIFQAMASCLGAFYGYYKLSANILYGSIVAAVVNCGINYFMIPVIGIQAASFSTFMGFFAMWLIRIYGLRNIIKISITTKNKILSIVFIPLLFVSGISGLWQNIALIMFSILFAIAINKELVHTLINVVIKRLKRL